MESPLLDVADETGSSSMSPICVFRGIVTNSDTDWCASAAGIGAELCAASKVAIVAGACCASSSGQSMKQSTI